MGLGLPHQQPEESREEDIDVLDGLDDHGDGDDGDVATSQSPRKNNDLDRIGDIDGLQRIDDIGDGDLPTSQLPRRRKASPEVVCPAKPPQAWDCT